MLTGFLKSQAHHAANRILAGAHSKVRKATTAKDLVQLALDFDWNEIIGPTESSLYAAGASGAEIGLAQISINDVRLISASSHTAREWAHKRGAEMVGKQWRKGQLVITRTLFTELMKQHAPRFERSLRRHFRRKPRSMCWQSKFRRRAHFPKAAQKQSAAPKWRERNPLGRMEFGRLPGW